MKCSRYGMIDDNLIDKDRTERQKVPLEDLGPQMSLVFRRKPPGSRAKHLISNAAVYAELRHVDRPRLFLYDTLWPSPGSDIESGNHAARSSSIVLLRNKVPSWEIIHIESSAEDCQHGQLFQAPRQ
jgi:hypothetical protein